MPIKTIERNFWQATLHFDVEGYEPSGPGLASLFAKLPRILPTETGGSWEFPALTGGKLIVQIGNTGMRETQALIAMGFDLRGWHIELGASSLTVRQQQEVVGYTIAEHPERPQGERWLPEDSLPDRSTFLSTVAAAIDALPTDMTSRVQRVGLTAEYVGVVDGHPGAWIAAQFNGREAPSPLPNNVVAVRGHTTQEFVDAYERRYVWNEQTRVGSWFGPDGILLRDCAVVFNSDFKTALEEVAGPPWGPATAPGSPLSTTEISSFFADAPSGALELVLARLRRRFPQGAASHE